MNALKTTRAQRAAGELIGLMELNTALPNAVFEALTLTPETHHGEFLRVIQKHIEQNQSRQATGLAQIVGVTK